MRRVLVLLGTLLLMMAGLSACGDDTGSGSSADEDSGKVSIAGKFGKEPKVTFDGNFSVSNTKVDVITEGDGATLEEGDAVFANLFMANGYTGETLTSTWEEGGRTTVLELSDNTIPAIKNALEGHKVGTRVAVQAAPDDAYGDAGNDELAIAPQDTVVFVIDAVDKIPDTIDAGKTPSPKGGPKVVQKDGAVTGLKFSGKPSKIDKLETEILLKGKGPKAKKGDTLAVKYLGQVNGKKAVFDENFAANGHYPITLGAGGSIEGWDQGLTGARAGSRILLRVPSALGYGDQGNGKDIKPGDDLVFVIDVLAINK